ncbi:hypothetical protein [Microseira wollei]|uniref:Uncharacterized protein n=1 Tax=Microseira wollei NIES-4236 TaxID=2530354 RepID=A0AAV3X8F6_9CYAN|nr:hypothetical protein [Microseira wollei]GET38448.1 hypothetical protein MiSe_32060 [Microseira wollei NIES-4236]
MTTDTNMPVVAIVNDLEALISEIDNNPELSPWVVRLILKSIKDKAKKMATEFPPRLTSVSETENSEVFSDLPFLSTTKVKVLQQRRCV